MPKRVTAKAYIDPRLALTDGEVVKICTAGKINAGGVEIKETEDIIKSYILKSIVFYKSATPRNVNLELNKLSNKIRSAQKAIISITPASDNSDYIVARAAGEEDPLNLTEEDREVLERHLRKNRFQQKTDAEISEIAAGHVLNKVIKSNIDIIVDGADASADLNWYSIVLDDLLMAIDVTIDKLKSNGGKIGDINFYPFIAELVDMYCRATGHGPYTDETRKFICAVRDVVRDRFLKIGLKEAAYTVTQSYYAAESTEENVNGLIKRALAKADF